MYYLRSLKLLLLLLRLQRNLHSGQLVNSLGEFHGFPQKLGQHLTLYEGEASQVLQTLCNQGTSEFRDISSILAELGVAPVTAPQNISQASIGQVFRVQTREYGDIAVKLKYPHIAGKLGSDSKVLRAVAYLAKPFLPNGNYLLDTIAFISGKLLEECDYHEELHTQTRVFQTFAADSHIHVPRPITALCNSEVLVSQWVNGVFLEEALANAACEQKLQIYDLLWNFELQLFWRLGMIHADPHQGNFLVTGTRQTPELTILDFGSKLEFTTEQRNCLAAIVMRACDLSQLNKHLRVLGFGDEVLAEYQPVLGDIITVMFEPFYADADYDFRSWRLAYKINTILSSANFHQPFTIPPVLLTFLRMVHGLYYYAQKHRLAYNWRRNMLKITDKSGGLCT
ncbi:putative protein kinase UbiB [Sporomusa ovata DSM 2662]|uniref:ABC1 family protein n=1 Tax=Sporomusa ovata TaxID=2378 RepID=A0A0U1KSM0_9FIRM|nr:AarF/UbiB family protein [Sporomusa ovata]EQB24923.1 ABC-1 domain containing protein [Sporomusa ovata DSM 2662]CQR70119.1 ABC1 family protein [Sporomusa ovata]